MLSVGQESQFFFFVCFGNNSWVGRGVLYFGSGATLSYQATVNNSLEPSCCSESNLSISTFLCISHFAFLMPVLLVLHR